MQTRLLVGLLVIGACLFIPAVNASRKVESATGKGSKELAYRRFGAINIDSYRSPGSHHKVIVENGPDNSSDLASSGATKLAGYESFNLYEIDSRELETMSLFHRGSNSPDPDSRVKVRDDLNVLMLRSGFIDTTADDTPGSLMAWRGSAATPAPAVSSRSADGSSIQMIQVVGPVKHAWVREMEASGIELIAYIPNNAYLVRSDSKSLSRLMQRDAVAAARGEGFIQWQGPFLDEYKIHPALTVSNADLTEEISVAVQLALGRKATAANTSSELQSVRKLASSVLVDAYPVSNFTNLRIRIARSNLAKLASLDSVINIEPWQEPRMFDERAAQVGAGQLNSDRTSAKGPGYSAWLTNHGFTSNFSFLIDVSDSGVDRGFTTPDKLHPDFLDSSKQSRLMYARDYTSELDPGDVPGHGTLNMSIAAGANMSSDSRDAAGFSFGLGVAPFAMLGSSKIFQSNGRFDLIDPYTKLVSDAYHDGARVSSNSWGDASNVYSIDSQEYDARARDAAPDLPGNQELIICFAAGNAGPNKSIGSPSTAKNVISVAAGESSRKDGTDGCFVSDALSDSAMDMAFFSSGGPLEDGRIKPDITAPGTHIEGAASQHPDFDGTGVCGQAIDKPFFPTGQTLYTWSSGTSHSTPAIAGAAALARQFLTNRGEAPNAAMIKALLLNTTTYMTGEEAGGNLPHPRQGWGLVNLDRAFDNTPRIFVNQTNTFTDSGATMTITGEIKDSTQPFRVTLAWSDAPGFSGAAPWVNDLDLEVLINGQLYRGNNFAGQDSQPGGNPDTKNNVEAVWLPAGTVGTFVIRVRATNIAGDGVPGNLDPTDQDFALAVYNGERKDAGVASITAVSLTGGADAFADPGETVSMRLTIGDLSPVTMTAPHGVLTSPTNGVTVTSGGSDFATIAQGQTSEGATPFAFTVASNVACGSVINFALDVTSLGLVSRVPFSIRVGKGQPTDFFVDDVESGEAKWTHGSAIRKKKNRVDTWSLSQKRVHSGATSWFTKDPGDKIVDAHLDSIPIQLPAEGRSIQLTFFHTFEFERGTFDGGVLEISTGGDFEDLGPKIIKGGYTGTVFEFTDNPLAGQLAWVEGRLGAFEQVVVDLSSFAGKTVTIRFRIGTDDTGKGLGWYIDDVRLNGDRISCTP